MKVWGYILSYVIFCSQPCARPESTGVLQGRVIIRDGKGETLFPLIRLIGPYGSLIRRIRGNGTFTFTGLRYGVWQIQVSAPGYCQERPSQSVVIVSDSINEIYASPIVLVPCPDKKSTGACEPPTESISRKSNTFTAFTIDKGSTILICASGVERSRLVNPNGSVTALAVSSTGASVASGDNVGAVIIWDARSGRLLRQLSLGAKVSVVTFSDDTLFVAAGSSQGAVRVWQIATSAVLADDDSVKGAIDSLNFSPDRQYLVVFSGGRSTFLQLTRTGPQSQQGR